MSPDEILEHIRNIKILGPGTKIIVSKTSVFDESHYKGYARIEVNKVRHTIWENTNSLEVRRTILKYIDKSLLQKHVQMAKIRVPFFEISNKIREIADSAVRLQEQSDGPGEFQKKVQTVIEERAKQKRMEDFSRNMGYLKALLSSSLKSLSEEELIDIYRLARVQQVMES